MDKIIEFIKARLEGTICLVCFFFIVYTILLKG